MCTKFLTSMGIIAAAIVTLSFTTSQRDSHQADVLKDSVVSRPLVREVLTAQKLVVDEVNPDVDDKDTVDFVAKIRDVFTVISYDGDKSSVVLNWTVCPDGKCPEAKIYRPNTTDYRKLDSLVIQELKKVKLKKN